MVDTFDEAVQMLLKWNIKAYLWWFTSQCQIFAD